MRSKLICLFINLFVCFLAKAQINYPVKIVDKGSPVIRVTPGLLPQTIRSSDTTTTATVYNNGLEYMISNYYTSTLGFFCRKEIEIEKALRMPVKFRLGCVEYTDKMEGKCGGG